MTSRPVKDVAASVRARLLNLSQSHGVAFNELLQHYAIERFLFRLSVSEHRDRLVLKGGAMLVAWHGNVARPTRDIDLLGRGDNSTDELAGMVREICQVGVPDDGTSFDAGTVVAEEIMEAARYQGVRVSFSGYLGQARIPMRLDIGFGDVVIPGPVDIEYPTLLDSPVPTLRAYTR